MEESIKNPTRIGEVNAVKMKIGFKVGNKRAKIKDVLVKTNSLNNDKESYFNFELFCLIKLILNYGQFIRVRSKIQNFRH